MIVEQARRWVGTPFKHQGRARGVGVDCVGLLIGIGRDVGLVPASFDITGYGREPHNGELMRQLSAYLDQKRSPPADGDVLLMTFMKVPMHVGIYTGDGTVIHAYEGVGRCVEHGLNQKWLRRIVGVYQWRGVN